MKGTTEYLVEREREKEQRAIRQFQLKGYQVSKVSQVRFRIKQSLRDPKVVLPYCRLDSSVRCEDGANDEEGRRRVTIFVRK